MAISILNYYEQPDGKNLMIMADDLYERNPGEAPDDNMPMDPTNYAISQNLGVPADGSIMIVRDFDEDKKVKTVTNVFKDSEWKDSTEKDSTEGVKIGYINTPYNPEELLTTLETYDMIFAEAYGLPGYVHHFMTSNCSFNFTGPGFSSTTAPDPTLKFSDETKAKIIDILKTKFSKQISVTYT